MSTTPEARNRSAHLPDQGKMIDERIRAGRVEQSRDPLHTEVIGGSGTTSETDGSGGPGSGSTVTSSTWYKFYATSAVNDGFSTGHVPDGSRTEFTLEDADGFISPTANSLDLYINGQALAEGYHYTLTDDTITFSDPPPANAVIFGKCEVGEIAEE